MCTELSAKYLKYVFEAVAAWMLPEAEGLVRDVESNDE